MERKYGLFFTWQGCAMGLLGFPLAVILFFLTMMYLPEPDWIKVVLVSMMVCVLYYLVSRFDIKVEQKGRRQ
jgi:ABC-type antimicrobial peptide transport system permease subunit